MRKLQVTDLLPEEREIVEHVYGHQVHSLRGFSPKHIAYMRDITEDEQEFFSRREGELTGSLLQTLYKIKGKLVPLRFNRALNILSQHEDALRMNFCDVGNRILVVVFQERMETPEIIYRNLEKEKGSKLDDLLKSLMEADMRRDFAPKSGPILRFSVFHTGADEYAVVVTGIQAMLYNFDVRMIFAEVMDLPFKPQVTAVSSGLRSQMGDMSKPVKEYWQKNLADLPPQPVLPYLEENTHGQHQDAYLSYVPHNIFASLREKSRGNKIMLMSMLQTAWGILLEQVNNTNDAAYCIVVPRYMDKNSENSAQSLVPIRLTIKGNPMVQTIVTKAFQQFVISQPYASLGRRGIAQIIGQQETLFDHFLNFHDFFLEGASYSAVPGEPMGRLVVQNSWDTRDIKLGIGFRHEENELVMTFSYDNTFYTSASIERLMAHYILVLQQMAADWNDSYSIFLDRLEKHVASADQIVKKKEKKKDSRAELQNYLSRLDLLQNCENGVLQPFVENSHLAIYFEGDSLPEELLKKQLVFLVEGKVARSMESGDGWYNALDIKKENRWLNELIFLDHPKSRMSVEVLTEQAKFLVISLASVQAMLKRYPRLGLNMLKYIARQLEKYQRLWVQS